MQETPTWIKEHLGCFSNKVVSQQKLQPWSLSSSFTKQRICYWFKDQVSVTGFGANDYRIW